MKNINFFLVSIVVVQSLIILWISYFFCGDTQTISFNNEPSTSYVSTVVTAYFPLESAKHTKEEYNTWLQTFFKIEAPIVIYTTPEIAGRVKKLTNNRGSIKIITEYESPFDIEVNMVFKDVYNGKQYDMDPEKYHNGYLYAIWNGKSALLARTAKENHFNTTYFFWVDIGSFRVPGPPYRDWPNNERVLSIWEHAANLLNKNSSEILLMSNVYSFNHQFNGQFSWGSLSNSPLRGPSIIGTFFGGPAQAVQWWYRDFYYALSYYFAKDLFIGKDQEVMNSVAAQNEARIVSLDASNTKCGDIWFFFQPFLSRETEYKKEYPKFNCHEDLIKRMRDLT